MTYDETATNEKISRERRKFPLQEEICFLIFGMMVVRPLAEGERKGGEMFELTKEWCMALMRSSAITSTGGICLRTKTRK